MRKLTILPPHFLHSTPDEILLEMFFFCHFRLKLVVKHCIVDGRLTISFKWLQKPVTFNVWRQASLLCNMWNDAKSTGLMLISFKELIRLENSLKTMEFNTKGKIGKIRTIIFPSPSYSAVIIVGAWLDSRMFATHHICMLDYYRERDGPFLHGLFHDTLKNEKWNCVQCPWKEWPTFEFLHNAVNYEFNSDLLEKFKKFTSKVCKFCCKDFSCV